MSDNSAIEWTDASWNPIRARNLKTGKIGWHCEHSTTGCEFCYAEGFNKRLGTGLPFKPGHRKDIEIFLDEEMLLAPLRWKKPRRIFLCSMTDLFADFVKDEWIDRVFAVMALCPQHTFQCLTKRAERMQDYMQLKRSPDAVGTLMNEIAPQHWCKRELDDYNGWPLDNIWLGVSCERQEEFDERHTWLGSTPAAVRFFSFEPLLGPINTNGALDAGVFHWAIVGGESGRHSRPMHVEWVDAIRDQCRAAGVACFIKQLGSVPLSGGYPLRLNSAKGGDPSEWPMRLRVREFPNAAKATEAA
jgi:protein gp37